MLKGLNYHSYNAQRHSQTERQTDHSIMPIANHTSLSAVQSAKN